MQLTDKEYGIIATDTITIYRAINVTGNYGDELGENRYNLAIEDADFYRNNATAVYKNDTIRFEVITVTVEFDTSARFVAVPDKELGRKGAWRRVQGTEKVVSSVTKVFSIKNKKPIWK